MAELNAMGAKCYTIEIKPSLSLGMVTDLTISSPQATFHLSLIKCCTKLCSFLGEWEGDNTQEREVQRFCTF